MTVETVTLFLALLAVVAAATSVALVVSYVAGDPLGLWAAVQPVAVELAAAVAVTATVGSLYLSEGANFDPCRLCWVQRGFMYPAALVLVGALAVRRLRHHLAAGAAGLALLGLPVAIFHRYEQAVGSESTFCDPINPCSVPWVTHFGFMTIPTMAGIGFVAIIVLVGLDALTRRSVR